ncbi:uncharacterized protein LOC123510920 [Portunus trituberculatus]|uniref:uncharacterized protein LOC123510920 n=1 Tax=Portunus trituberculatus TaxID=210409 RepID=UPI001E1CE4A2|nr:uncharacterized protein LOC123510920 [Portunus trituberculatus]
MDGQIDREEKKRVLVKQAKETERQQDGDGKKAVFYDGTKEMDRQIDGEIKKPILLEKTKQIDKLPDGDLNKQLLHRKPLLREEYTPNKESAPRRRRRGATEKGENEETKAEQDTEPEELPTPAELAWIDPTELVSQGAYVEDVPSIANLVGLRLFKYEFPPPALPRSTAPGSNQPMNARSPMAESSNQPVMTRPPLTPKLNQPMNVRSPVAGNSNQPMNARSSLHPGSQLINMRSPYPVNPNTRPLHTNTQMHPRLSTSPNTISSFGDSFHDSFDRYYKKFRDPSHAYETSRATGVNNIDSYPRRPPYPSRPVYPSTTDTLLNLLNPLNLFSHNNFPQIPRYPNPLPPPHAPQNPPRLPQSPRNAPEKDSSGGLTYEVIVNQEAEKHKGYQFKEDYPLRDDLYVGQDGNIYLKGGNGVTHTPSVTAEPPTYHLDHQDHGKDHEDRFLNEYSKLLNNHNLDNYNYLDEDYEYDYYSSEDDHDSHDTYATEDTYRTPRPTQRPHYETGYEGYTDYPRQQRAPYPYPPSPPNRAPWSMDSGILGWLLGPLSRPARPNYYYSPREVQIPRFRYDTLRYKRLHSPNSHLSQPSPSVRNQFVTNPYSQRRRPSTPITRRPHTTHTPTKRPTSQYVPTSRPVGSNKGFYPGNGFFDTDFPTLFHMEEESEELPTPLPAAVSTSTTTPTTTPTPTSEA